MSIQGTWCQAIVEGLHRGVVRHAVVCPGSRSTPLALALAAHPHIQTHAVIDERSAGFFALGIAKADGRAAAVLTTSGTAVANLLPAVVEANQSSTPLVVLSADRPPELRDRGANQTIDQVGIFGRQVRWAVDLPPPDADRVPWVQDLAQKAGQTFRNHPPGPVHLNVPLREPLEPDDEDAAALAARAVAGQTDDAPAWQGRFGSDRADVFADMGVDWSLKASGNRGVIVVGPRHGREDTFAHHVTQLAKKLRVPVIADVLSGLRGHRERPAVVSAHDTFLADAHLRDKLRPDWILQFGRSPTSKAVRQWIAAHPGVPRIRVDSTGRGWDDIDTPVGIYQYDDVRFLEMVREPGHFMVRVLERHLVRAKPDATWRDLWHAMDAAAWAAIGEALDSPAGRGTEPAITRAVARHHWGARFLGSSLPVRDWERFVRAGQEWPFWQAFGNRGASGIDGSIATAAGIGTVQPCVAVVGDVAFQHDVGSLALLRDSDATIVVVNNGGGQIFRHLPIRERARIGDTDHFERLWLTPPTLDIGKACHASGLRFTQVAPGGLAGVVAGTPDPDDSGRTIPWDVIEVVVDAAASARFRQEVQAQVADAVRPLVDGLAPRPPPDSQP